jgi:tRNA dimethylallyltransferase
MSSADPILTFLFGCTGSGKSEVGVELARRINAEIISIDSMQVYRGMDIGTAKPACEIRRSVPHHLIDVADPWEEFSVARYVELAAKVIAEIHARRRPILVVGGTPLYIKALSEGLFEGPGADPAVRARLEQEDRTRGRDFLYRRLLEVDPRAAARIHPNDLRRIVRALEVHELTAVPISEHQQQWDRQRTRYDCRFFGLRRGREDLHRRINERVRWMIADGFVEEVQSLLALPRTIGNAARQALGYAELIEHLEGKFSLAEAVEFIKINTRRFAKAQRTWFRRFVRTEWLDAASEATAEQTADDWMKHGGFPWSPSPK